MWVRIRCISGVVEKNGSGNRGRSCKANSYCVSVLSKISVMRLEIVISVCMSEYLASTSNGEHLSK